MHIKGGSGGDNILADQLPPTDARKKKEQRLPTFFLQTRLFSSFVAPTPPNQRFWPRKAEMKQGEIRLTHLGQPLYFGKIILNLNTQQESQGSSDAPRVDEPS